MMLILSIWSEIEFIPIVTYDNKGITLAKNERKEKILVSFEKRNRQLENGEWKNGWHEFCLSVEENYVNVLKKVYKEEPESLYREFFAHYLDCEAHSDVWRELFKTYNYTNEKN